MIARIGYEADLRFLRVIMRDVSVYDVAPVTAAEWQEFQSAPSKGVFWHRVFAARAFKSGDKIETRTPQDAAVSHPAVASNPYTEIAEHDDCCNKPFARDSRGGKLAGVRTWTCPKCGCEWKPRDAGAGVRHWIPVVQFEVLRLRG